jgi:hypothetical protein
MKRLCLCVAATLAMVSCIPVDDFGTYWDKGVVDPALEGTWKIISLLGSSPDSPEARELRFTRTGSFYSMNVVGIDPPTDPEVWGNARTLRVGKRRLLMQRNRRAPFDGILTSYEIRGRTLSEYWLHGSAAAELRTRHPGAKNIHKNEGEGEFVVIGRFDDEVFRILSEIADDPTYWILTARYERASN